jgi:hypothetical protein
MSLAIVRRLHNLVASIAAELRGVLEQLKREIEDETHPPVGRP